MRAQFYFLKFFITITSHPISEYLSGKLNIHCQEYRFCLPLYGGRNPCSMHKPSFLSIRETVRLEPELCCFRDQNETGRKNY